LHFDDGFHLDVVEILFSYHVVFCEEDGELHAALEEAFEDGLGEGAHNVEDVNEV
jgi:hypothetical protein